MEPQLPFSTAILFGFAISALTLLILWKKSKASISASNPPPGPPKLPLIGNLHQLICLLPHHRLSDLARTYGPDLLQLQLGQVPAIVVSSPDAAEQVMKNFDVNFIERGREYVTNIVFYNRMGVVWSPYGDHWRKMRKICTLKLFSSRRVKSFRFIREEEVLNSMKWIDSKVGSPINFSKMISSLTNSATLRAAIGCNTNNQEALIQLIHQLLGAINGFSFVDFFPSLKFIHSITGMQSRLEKLHQRIDLILEDIIKEHRQWSTKGGESEPGTLLDVLLKLQAENDQNYPLTTDAIKATLLDIFVGGTDTSATTIEWAMSELMKNPRILKKAQEEVREASIKCGKIDETCLDRLHYLKAIIKETLRLHPPTPLIPRLCREECNIYGYNIKSKIDIIINIWAIGRDTNYWNEPERFYPERFIDSEIDYKGLDFEYIPFGAGRRICPGMLFGLASVEIVLAQVLCLFNWELPYEMNPKDLDMMEAFSTTVRRKNDLYLIATPYHHPMVML